MEILEHLYNVSPIAIQNFMISAYGLKLKRLRYGRRFHECLCLLKKSEYSSKQEIHNLQSRLFASLVANSAAHAPFYKDILLNKGIDISQVNFNNYKSIFPVVTKEVLRNNADKFISSRHSSNSINIHTSGTSGTPLKIKVTSHALQNNYAFFVRFLESAGINLGEKCATFAGRAIIPPKQNRPPYWRRNRLMNTLLMSSYHISDKTIPYYIDQLEIFKPSYIDSYPSAITAISDFINSHGINHRINPKCIITSSETLLENQRSSIEQAFKCKVYDHLGSAEMVTFITECESGCYHVSPEYGLIETLDDHDRPVSKGSPGRLVCTGLFNYAMPLIRYDLGDTITLSDNECDCGRKSQIVETIIGRTDDIIIGCDGIKIGRLDPVFKKINCSIKETQIIQTSLDKITVKMVVDSSYEKKNTDIIANEIKRRAGNCMTINFEYVTCIEKTSAGKFKSVISLVKQNM